MNRLKSLISTIPFPQVRIIPVLMVLALPIGCLDAQQIGVGYWVYTLTEQKDAFEVSRTNALDGHSEQIVLIPKAGSFNLLSIVPTEEVNAAEELFVSRGDSAGDASDFLNHPPEVLVASVVPSPDNQIVALHVIYRLCTYYPSTYCFGVSRIVLVTVATGEQRVAWTLGIQAATSYTAVCDGANQVPFSLSNTLIKEVRWTPDQTALVATVYDWRDTQTDPLVVIPLNALIPAFRVGDAVAWAIAPNSREVTALTRGCGQGEVTAIISFDPITGQFSRQDYPRNPLVANYFSGIAYLKYKPIFVINNDTSRPEYDPGGGGIALFDPNLTDNLSLFPVHIDGYSEIHSSLSGETAVIQSENGRLWQIKLIEDNQLEVTPLTSLPVTYWQFADNSTLIVRYENAPDSDYEIIKIPVSNDPES